MRETVKLAVALGHVPENEHAPKILAGGRGAVAKQILNITFAQGVRVRKDADLAQLLAAVDSENPVQAFAAVTEILVYVWRANGAGPDAAARDQPLPDRPYMERAKGPAG